MIPNFSVYVYKEDLPYNPYVQLLFEGGIGMLSNNPLDIRFRFGIRNYINMTIKKSLNTSCYRRIGFCVKQYFPKH